MYCETIVKKTDCPIKELTRDDIAARIVYIAHGKMILPNVKIKVSLKNIFLANIISTAICMMNNSYYFYYNEGKILFIIFYYS